MDVDQWRGLVKAARNARGGSLGKRMRGAAIEETLAAELLAEQAVSLARVGRRLQQACDRAGELCESLLVASDARERATLAEAYRQARGQAKQVRWEIIVQREAIGLQNHHDLDEIYPMPPTLAELDRERNR